MVLFGQHPSQGTLLKASQFLSEELPIRLSHRIAELEANVQDRFRMLGRSRKRAEWSKHQEAQKVAKEENEEKERIAYAQIDWHDFVVVETVLFDEDDENHLCPKDLSEGTSK